MYKVKFILLLEKSLYLKYKKDMKILFINFGGLGDEILFLPTIISIKKQFPNAEITLALEPRSKGVTSLTNIIDNTLFADIKGLQIMCYQ